MSREVHVPFCERLRGKFPQSTHHQLHWVLDVTFREDDSRIRPGYASENFNIVRQLAINLLKNEPSKLSIKRKRFRAALNDQFREKVIFSS